MLPGHAEERLLLLRGQGTWRLADGIGVAGHGGMTASFQRERKVAFPNNRGRWRESSGGVSRRMLEALLPKSATRVVVYLEPINVRSGVKKPALGCGLGD